MASARRLCRDRTYLQHLAGTKASAVILGPTKGVEPARAVRGAAHDDPYPPLRAPSLSFAQAIRPAPALIVERRRERRVDCARCLDRALRDDRVGARVGARTIIYPNVVIGPGADVGEDCVIHSQASSASASSSSPG